MRRRTRWLERLVIASLVIKVAVWGTWWTTRSFAESAGAGQGGKPGAAPNAGLPPQLLEQSRGFRELLEAVSKRQQELDARERTLAEREAGLSQLEKTVADQVAKLESLAGVTAPVGERIGARGGARPGAGSKAVAAGAAAGEADKAAGITRIYESMKAEEAAPILDKLDDDTLRVVLSRMKERQIGAILAAMQRDRAVSFTKLLAGTQAEDGPAKP